MSAWTPLTGQVAVVTGASRGIGLAVADVLHGAGAHVVRLARSLKDATSERRTDVRCDVTDQTQVERAAAMALKVGAPDIVVNNAGMFFIKRLAETSAGDFAAMLAVNLTACFLVARTFLPAFHKRGRGHLVTIGSVSDHHAFPGSAAYASSKFGVRGLHEVIAAELAGTGIRTTLLSPGPVDTTLWDEVDPDSTPGFTKRAAMLKPSDVADAVLFAVTRPARVNVDAISLLPAVYTPRD
jgi:NADP-dependent 3-hydroxy acid dehydrogenase YdfG